MAHELNYKLHHESGIPPIKRSQRSILTSILCCFFLRRRTTAFTRLVLILTLSIFLSLLFYYRGYRIKNTISYISRPLWDTPQRPHHVITHYYAEGISQDVLCALHNWTLYPEDSRPRVYDAFIFSNEFDLLEIRLHELMPVVDKFVILESGHTFTGMPKPLWLKENMDRYAFAADKIVYKNIPGRSLLPGEDPFNLEGEQRIAMNNLLSEAGVRYGDMVLMSDADEIPYRNAIALVRYCSGVPFPLHLQVTDYLYSFEFPIDMDGWSPQVHRYSPDSYYRHSLSSENLLADAGWHCSFCFRNLGDFAFKMRAYSHTDRIGGREELLEPKWIQDVICKGANIFDMLPEAYTYVELFRRWGNMPKQSSAVHLPRHLVEHAERFKFLLPGGCIREG